MYEAVYIHDLPSVMGLYNAYRSGTPSSTRPFDPFTLDPAGRTYLHICGSDLQHKIKPRVDVDCARILSALLSFGIDGSHRCDGGWAPLDVYAAQGYPEVVNTLVAHPTVTVDGQDKKHGMTALMRAAINGHSKVAEILLDAKANPNLVSWGGFTALMYATRNEVLSFRGGAKSDEDRAAMMDAGYATVIVRESGSADDEAPKSTISPNPEEQQRDSCSDPFDPNCVDRGVSPGKEWSAVISALLAHGCEVNLPDDRGVTPIMVAARGGHVGLVEKLLQGGKVDLKRTDKDGLGAISYSSNDQVRQMLVDYLDKMIVEGAFK